jgi:hypothetical protein
MFLQLVTPPPAAVFSPLSAIDSLFLYTPLQIAALVETVWRNRYNAGSANFTPWPQWMTEAILASQDPTKTNPNFVSGYKFPDPPAPFPAPGAGAEQWPFPLPSGGAFMHPIELPGVAIVGGAVQPTNWDHAIYAYLIENTRIFDVFARLLETYAYSEDLETPSPAAQNFWRATEYLIYGDGLPSAIWNTTSRARRDEVAYRQTLYNWMFGMDLSHAAELAKEHPYRKPAASNRDFIPTLHVFLREVWKGIMNAKNISGPNTTDPVAIATAARRLFDMMATRRINGNLSREEFRAVAVMSWLHLAVMYDSPAVVDLKAAASSPEQRLDKLAQRVGLRAHSRAKSLFDLAQPFSYLMQSVELGAFNDPAGAALLFNITSPNNVAELNAEIVIDQYSIATGIDLKASSIIEGPARSVPARPVPSRQPLPARASGATNGRLPALTR